MSTKEVHYIGGMELKQFWTGEKNNLRLTMQGGRACARLDRAAALKLAHALLEFAIDPCSEA